MKAALKDHSISLCPGGMREMLYEDTAILERRRGIFKLALETGTPLVPVISKGESDLTKIVELDDWLQDFLKPYDACIPIPTWKSFTKIMGLTQNPLKDPVFTVIGEPIEVQKIEEPSEQDILELKKKYIDSLKKMYKKEMGKELKII